MNGSLPIGLYVRLASTGTNWSLPSVDIPAWENYRQEIQPSGENGIELVEQVVATGLTLRGAWAAMVALATPLKENQT